MDRAHRSGRNLRQISTLPVLMTSIIFLLPFILAILCLHFFPNFVPAGFGPSFTFLHSLTQYPIFQPIGVIS